MGEEADALNDILEDGFTSDEERREYERSLLQSGYEAAKHAKVGSMMSCAYCGKRVKKKSYQQKFCSNKGQANCKDKYWNSSTDERLAQTRYWNGLD